MYVIYVCIYVIMSVFVRGGLFRTCFFSNCGFQKGREEGFMAVFGAVNLTHRRINMEIVVVKNMGSLIGGYTF